MIEFLQNLPWHVIASFWPAYFIVGFGYIAYLGLKKR